MQKNLHEWPEIIFENSDSLNKINDIEDLLLIFERGLEFISKKNECHMVFIPDWLHLERILGDTSDIPIKVEEYKDKVTENLATSHNKLEKIDNFHVFSYSINIKEYNLLITGSVFIFGDLKSENIFPIEKDLSMLLENWKSAYYTLILQKKVKEEKVLRENEHLEKIESIASMVSGISHEVNTPLGIIKTTSSVLEQLIDNFLSDEFIDERETLIADIRDSCSLIDKNVFRAANLIQSFKKVSSSQLHDQACEINLLEIVNDSILTISPNLKKSRITVNVHPKQQAADYSGFTFPGYISQVIFNMIENTIRYGYPDGQGGAVDIYLDIKDDNFVISYIDHGQGIDEEFISKIFDAFYTTGRNKGGTGLGLAIVQNLIVNLLKGSISCYSKKNMGVDFTITLKRFIDATKAT